MTRNSREQELLRRLHAAGLAEPSGQTGAPFKFLISPKTSNGVVVGRLPLQMRDEVFSRIRTHVFQSPLTGIVFFPTILDPKIAVVEDKLTHKRTEKEMFVALNIPFRDWEAASAEQRIDLLAGNLLESIRRIPSKHLPDSDKAKLASFVDEARQVVKARLLH